jgi:hypothetical protein
MKQMKVLALGATALTAGTLLMSEIALADGYRNSHAAHHARRFGWWYANAGALNTNPYYGYFPTYSSPNAYVPYAYGPYGYGYGYGRPLAAPGGSAPWLGFH